VNIRCGFWRLAERAAIDLGDLLTQARRRRLADPQPSGDTQNRPLMDT
jgi:hypothetical protein